jgi:hypothetical protein
MQRKVIRNHVQLRQGKHVLPFDLPRASQRLDESRCLGFDPPLAGLFACRHMDRWQGVSIQVAEGKLEKLNDLGRVGRCGFGAKVSARARLCQTDQTVKLPRLYMQTGYVICTNVSNFTRLVLLTATKKQV